MTQVKQRFGGYVEVPAAEIPADPIMRAAVEHVLSYGYRAKHITPTIAEKQPINGVTVIRCRYVGSRGAMTMDCYIENEAPYDCVAETDYL